MRELNKLGLNRSLLDPSIKTVSLDIADKRLSICQECPMYETNEEMCNLCGCFMPAKTLKEDATCPIHNW